MATQAKGSRSQIIYDCETTFKSTPSPVDAHVLPFVSESLRMTRNLIDSQSIRANRNQRQPVIGNREVAGDITVELDPYMGRMFYHALGTVTTSGSDPYSHTFTISDLPAGLVFEKKFDMDTDTYFIYNGCKINSMRVVVRPENFIETTFNIMGAAQTITTTSIDASPTDYAAGAYGGAFTGFEATIEENGVALGVVTEIEFTIENNLDGNVFVIDGTGERYSMPEGLTKVSGTLRALFDSTDLYNRALNNTETNIVVRLTQGSGAGTQDNEKVEFYMREVLLAPQAPAIAGPAGITVELPFVAYYQDGQSASALEIVLWNKQTIGAVTSV